MHKLTNTLQRILWLIYVEIRYKLPVFGMMFLVCFAILMFYYWNPSFQVANLISELSNSNTRSFNTTTMINGVRYTTTSMSQAPELKYHIAYFSMAFIGLGIAIISVLFSEYGTANSKIFNISSVSYTHLTLPTKA